MEQLPAESVMASGNRTGFGRGPILSKIQNGHSLSDSGILEALQGLQIGGSVPDSEIKNYDASNSTGSPHPSYTRQTDFPQDEERIWVGNLCVRGHVSEMVIPAVGIRVNVEDKPRISDSGSWPSNLRMDLGNVKTGHSMLAQMHDCSCQWYARFSAVNSHGVEIEDSRLAQLVKVMVGRQLAFVVECNEQDGVPGTLYLWGVEMMQQQYSLIGMFLPAGKPYHGADHTFPPMEAQR